MKRRAFLSLGAAGALGLTAGSRRLGAQAQAPVPVAGDTLTPGKWRLGISDSERDGTVYVPMSYTPSVPMPVLIILHGFRGTAEAVRVTFPLAEEYGVIVLAPESRDVTWGQSIPGFDEDVRYIGMAFRWISDVLSVDTTRVAMGGVSDGANYALNMGLSYGDTFNHLMIFSAGLFAPFRRDGKPKVFLAHGRRDEQMPIERTARLFVPQLQADGYDVTYREYDGPHGAPAPVVREGFEWFAGKKG